MNALHTLAKELAQTLTAGGFLKSSQQDRLLSVLPQATGEALTVLGRTADAVRRARIGRQASLCAIINARSGRCGENCAFCAQSGHYATNVSEYPFLDPERIVAAAEAMRRVGVARFSMVASGKALPAGDLALAVTAMRGIRNLGMAPDASFGVLDEDTLERFKAAGLAAYHHNLETSRAFYPNICTTRRFDDNLAVLAACRKHGIAICSGGLFGMGESWQDRADLARTLLEAGAVSIPVNFLSPIPGTPLGNRPILTPDEARRIVILLRLFLPDRHIRLCGGRPTVFGATDPLAPMGVGADGLMVGDYLTTSGASWEADRQGLAKLGFVVADPTA